MSDNTTNSNSETPLAGETKRKVTILVVAVGLIFTFSVIGYFALQDAGKDIDVETGEKEIAEATDDPQCRAYIAAVTNIGRDFKADDALGGKMLSDQAEQVADAKLQFSAFKARLEKSKEGISESNFRFEESEEQLSDWYKAIDTELKLVNLLLNERLEKLAPEQKDAAEGTVVAEGKKWKSKKTPEERRDGALLAINEAFQSFRVWHSGGMHPCGSAAEGETPWTPETP